MLVDGRGLLLVWEGWSSRSHYRHIEAQAALRTRSRADAPTLKPHMITHVTLNMRIFTCNTSQS